MTNKPRILVLGGCGFIGRNLVDYLISNDLVSFIRIVDKTPPQMAWLNRQHADIFNRSNVEFCSANLINQASCKNAFNAVTEHFENIEDNQWDYVFNCAAETRPGQSDAIYDEGICKLSLNCAMESAAHKVKRYIEFSSGNMCSIDQQPLKESDPIKPWTMVAKHKAKVEEKLTELNFNYTILRVPIVYGIGDQRGLTPRIVIAALYKHLNEPMKLLWNESMKLNTVHVHDVVAAAYELATNQIANKQCYNIVDDSTTSQGSVSKILSDVFNIKVDYWGIMMSSITKFKMQAVVEEINDKHMAPWANLCQCDQTDNTPLTPYMDEELLFYKHLNLCNSKLKDTGYKLKVPYITKERIEEIVLDFIQHGLLPRSLSF